MIDIPLGKALVPVIGSCGEHCFFHDKESNEDNTCTCDLTCYVNERADGNNVIFKLVDYPVERG